MQTFTLPASTINARDVFLQKIDKEIDLPAIGNAVARVVEMTSSDEDAVADLTYFILSDVALIQYGPLSHSIGLAGNDNLASDLFTRL